MTIDPYYYLQLLYLRAIWLASVIVIHSDHHSREKVVVATHQWLACVNLPIYRLYHVHLLVTPSIHEQAA